jgi:hypothetical protein
MFNRLPALPHGLRILIEALLDDLQQMLVLPARDPPLNYRPRFRALALFGRRPSERVDSPCIPASENLHKRRHRARTIASPFGNNSRRRNLMILPVMGRPGLGKTYAFGE